GLPYKLVRVLRGATGVEAFRLYHKEDYTGNLTVAWARDSQLLATAALAGPGILPNPQAEDVKIWSVPAVAAAAAEGGPLSDPIVLKGSGEIVGLAFHPDSTRLATLDRSQKNLRVWSVAGKEITSIKSLGFRWRPDVWSPDGQYVWAVAKMTETTRELPHVWNAVTGEQVLALKPRARPFTAVVWSPDETHPAIATLEDGVVRIWEPPGKLNALRPGTWSPDGRYLAQIDPLLVGPGEVRLLDTQTGQSRSLKPQLGGPLGTAAWSRDGTRIATAAADQTIRV